VLPSAGDFKNHTEPKIIAIRTTAIPIDEMTRRVPANHRPGCRLFNIFMSVFMYTSHEFFHLLYAKGDGSITKISQMLNLILNLEFKPAGMVRFTEFGKASFASMKAFSSFVL
jgi:hypothetical protein